MGQAMRTSVREMIASSSDSLPLSHSLSSLSPSVCVCVYVCEKCGVVCVLRQCFTSVLVKGDLVLNDPSNCLGVGWDGGHCSVGHVSVSPTTFPCPICLPPNLLQLK